MKKITCLVLGFSFLFALTSLAEPPRVWTLVGEDDKIFGELVTISEDEKSVNRAAIVRLQKKRSAFHQRAASGAVLRATCG